MRRLTMQATCQRLPVPGATPAAKSALGKSFIQPDASLGLGAGVFKLPAQVSVAVVARGERRLATEGGAL